MAKKYFAGCDVGSTYTKAVILDEQGNIVAHTTIRSKINSEQSAQIAMQEVIDQVPDLHSSKDLEYLIGTGYGRNKVPFADENVSEISCHAMGVHVTDPTVKAIIDIDIPYPRDQETKMSPRFLELKNEIWSLVYQEYLEVRK